MTTPVHIVVDNRLRVATAQLDEDVLADLQCAFDHPNPEHAHVRQLKHVFRRRYVRKVDPFIKTWREADGEISFPRGGTDRVRRVLMKHGLDWRFEDARSEGMVTWRGQIPDHVQPEGWIWDHQQRLVSACHARENCLLRAPTGSGKTSAVLVFVSQVKLPTVVLVDDGNLCAQWTSRAVDELGMAARDVGIMGDGKRRLAPLTIAMTPTLRQLDDEEWADVARRFGVVVADEVQVFGAPSFHETIDRFPARYRIGVSDSERRRDGKHFLIHDMFGSVEERVEDEELVEKGIIHDVEIRMLETDFRAPWYGYDPENPKKRPDFTRLLKAIVGDVQRSKKIMRPVLEDHQAGRSVVVLSARREHCVKLAAIAAGAGVRSGLLLGSKKDRVEFDRTLAGLKDRSLRFAVGTFKAFGKGMDVRAIDRGLIATPVGRDSQEFFRQLRGRFCRTSDGKDSAAIYYAWDVHVFGDRPLRSMRAWNPSVATRGADGWTKGRRRRRRARR